MNFVQTGPGPSSLPGQADAVVEVQQFTYALVEVRDLLQNDSHSALKDAEKIDEDLFSSLSELSTVLNDQIGEKPHPVNQLFADYSLSVDGLWSQSAAWAENISTSKNTKLISLSSHWDKSYATADIKSWDAVASKIRDERVNFDLHINDGIESHTTLEKVQDELNAILSAVDFIQTAIPVGRDLSTEGEVRYAEMKQCPSPSGPNSFLAEKSPAFHVVEYFSTTRSSCDDHAMVLYMTLSALGFDVRHVGDQDHVFVEVKLSNGSLITADSFYGVVFLGSFDEFTGKLEGDSKMRTFYLIENLEKFNASRTNSNFNSARLAMLMNSKFMHRNRNSITVDYGFRDQAAKFVDLGWIPEPACMKKMFKENSSVGD